MKQHKKDETIDQAHKCDWQCATVFLLHGFFKKVHNSLKV